MTHINKLNIGPAIHHYREKVRMSQKQLGAEAGIIVGRRIVALEKGMYRWKADELFNICKALGITCTEMVYFAEFGQEIPK